jgi:glycerol-3-phosphate O-acyltransferase
MAEYPEDSPRLLAQRVRQKLLEIYNLEKRGALGPVIKTYQEMMESVLYHPAIMDAVKKLAAEEGKSETALRKKAYKYYRAIASDFSIVVVKYFQKFMMWVFYKVFDDIKYNPEDFKKLREASRKGPLIIVPCHRSHMDYLIISSMFFENRIIPPHILAGDNLSFFPLGLLFRKSGAFFMKRSTRGKPLYVAVLRQYIKALVREGYSIEFFIEGGRTRTGKIMHPKLGMLKYLIEAAEEGYSDDIMFVPVGINYDRVLEEKSFQKELHGGKKKGESNKDVVQSGKYLRGGYGGVYLTFQDPMSYRALKSEITETDVVGAVAMKIVKKISEGVVVTPFALISSAMLVSSVRGFSLKDLKNRAAFFMEYLKSIRVPLSDALDGGVVLDDAVDRVIETFVRDGIISKISMEGDESGYFDEFYALKEEQRTRIDFYKNNIIHYLLPISLYSVACIAASKGGNSASAANIADEFLRLVTLLAKEFVYPPTMDDLHEASEDACRYFESAGLVSRDNGTVFFAEFGKDALHGCASLLSDVLEAYYLVGCTIAEQQNRKIEKSECIAQVRKNGVRRFHLGEIRHFESLSLPYYQSALSAYAAMGIIRERKKDNAAAEIVIENRESLESIIAEMKRWFATMEEWGRSRRIIIAANEESGMDDVVSGPIH